MVCTNLVYLKGFSESSVAFVNDGLAEFGVVVSSISFLAEFAKGNKDQLT